MRLRLLWLAASLLTLAWLTGVVGFVALFLAGHPARHAWAAWSWAFGACGGLGVPPLVILVARWRVRRQLPPH